MNIPTILGFLFSVLVGANATDPQIIAETPPETFPVGNTRFFREQARSFTRSISIAEAHNDNPDGPPAASIYEAGTVTSMFTPRSLENINLNGDWTEAQLIDHAKKGLAEWASGITWPANAHWVVVVTWDGWSPAGIPSAATFFESDVINFTLEQGSDGLWHAPKSVTDELRMKLADIVFMRIHGLAGARLRWWNGREFCDSGPYVSRNIGLTSAGKKLGFNPVLGSVSAPYTASVDIDSGLVALPAVAILNNVVGVLTCALADGTIVRYKTSDGTQLAGSQGEREPLMLIPEKRTDELGAYLMLTVFGTFDPLSELDVTFEYSSDFAQWEVMPVEETWSTWLGAPAVRAAANFTHGRMFFRARYRQ